MIYLNSNYVHRSYPPFKVALEQLQPSKLAAFKYRILMEVHECILMS